MHKPIPGRDYWPNQSQWPTQPPKPVPSLLMQAFVFMALFILMQASWQMMRDESIGHVVRGDITVKPAVMLINFLTPKVAATANGNQILATGGGLVIKIGCEGVEAMFILIAALLSASIAWRAKLHGVLIGTLLVYGFNQLRILTLFYTFRADKPLFYLLHGSIAPLALIVLAGLFYHYWLVKNKPISS